MQVHITSPSCLKIDPGFPSLHMLKLPPNPVQTSVLEQTRPGLVKAKGNIVFRTLIPQGEHPSIITNTRFGTRLAADRYLFDFRSEIRGQIYGTYQRVLPEIKVFVRGGVRIAFVGITYDTFSSDVRSFPLLSRLIPSATLSKLDSSVEKLQVYMNRTRQVPQLPEVQEEDIHKLILGLLVLKSDVHKETLTVDGQSLECLRFDYSATGEQAGTLLGYLMDTGGLSQGDINASFYLYGKTLVAVRCDGRAGENRAALRLDLGLDAAQGDVSIAVEKLENGEKSAFSYKIGARGADGAHTETASFGTQSISCDWQPMTGDMVLTLPGKSPISLNLSQAQDGFQIQTKDFAALIGINSQKGFDSTMTVRKGSAITTPKYKNLDEWSLDDLLVLLGSIGGLLGFK